MIEIYDYVNKSIFYNYFESFCMILAHELLIQRANDKRTDKFEGGGHLKRFVKCSKITLSKTICCIN
jgi:hypothetical protein